MDQADKRLRRLHELSWSHGDARRSSCFRLLVVLHLAVAVTAQPTAEFVRQLGYKQGVGEVRCNSGGFKKRGILMLRVLVALP